MIPTHTAAIGASMVQVHLNTPAGVFRFLSDIPPCTCRALSYRIKRQTDHRWSIVCQVCAVPYVLRPLPSE